MADDYALSMLKISLAQICQNVGFQSATNVSLSVLLDIYRRYLESMCRTMRRHSDHFGRLEPILEDVELMFGELRIPMRELNDYVHQVAPVPFKHKVPVFPVSRPSKLKIPSPDSEELLTRPDYIPSHLPLLKPEPPPPVPTIMPSQNIDGEQSKSAADDLGSPKFNAGRISVHRATIGKQDLSQCNDLIGDFSDFDAVKAGLVKFVRAPTPPPPRSVTPLTLSYPSAMSPTLTVPPTLIVKAPQQSLIQVAEERSWKKKPTILDVRSQAPKLTLSHPKLKINLTAKRKYTKKRLVMPIIVNKEEKIRKLKIFPPKEPGKRGRKKKPILLPILQSATDGDGFISSARLSKTKIVEQDPIIIVPEKEKSVDYSSGFNNIVDNNNTFQSISLDTSTATTGSSSVEELVTSVVEETHEHIKAQQKASEHFAASVNSVILSRPDSPSLLLPKNENIDILAGAGNISMVVSKKADILESESPAIFHDRPSTSTALDSENISETTTTNSEKLKSILSRTRLFMNKDVIRQRLNENKARKEAEQKKIQDVVEKSFPPIAKRQDDHPPLVASIPPVVITTSTAAPTAAISVESSNSSAKPSRRPPGIPPTTSLRNSSGNNIGTSTKPKSDKPSIRPMVKLDLKKKFDPLPPLFQPDTIIKTTISIPSSEQRKVAPLVISTKTKPSTDTIAIPAPTPVAEPKPQKAESTKLIIKLPHMTPSSKSASTTIGDKEKKKKHHHHHEKDKEKGKEKHKEKHREKSHQPTSSITNSPIVKKEKKEKLPSQQQKIESHPSTIAKSIPDTIPIASGSTSPKGLKLKINITKSKIVPEKEKEKEPKIRKDQVKTVESILMKNISNSRPSSVAASSDVDFEDGARQVVRTPPPRSPSARSTHTGSVVGSIGGGGYESPPPPTPSPGSSCPPSPIYVDTQGVGSGGQGRGEEEIVGPPAKKQRVEQWPEPPPVIKMEKPQPPVSVVPQMHHEVKHHQSDDGTWYCPVCSVPYQEGAEMIACDSCDNWFHWTCVGLTQAPPDDENWYCFQCRLRKASGQKRKQKTNLVKKKNK